MKRELFAALLLLLLIALSALNLIHVQRLTDNVLRELELSEKALSAGAADTALDHWQQAFRLWEGSYSYSHIFIRHSEIDAAAEDFYALKEQILSSDSGAAYELLRYRLRCIAGMEKPSLGSVF